MAPAVNLADSSRKRSSNAPGASLPLRLHSAESSAPSSAVRWIVTCAATKFSSVWVFIPPPPF